MTVTPSQSSWIAWPLFSLRSMLSQSSTLQTWAGVGDATAALAKIHLFAMGDATQKWYTLPTPQILLDWGDGFEVVREATMSSAAWLPTGSVLMSVQAYMDDLDADDPELDMADKVGQIINDITPLAGAAGNLSIQTFEILGFNRSDPEQANGYDILDLFGSIRFMNPYG